MSLNLNHSILSARRISLAFVLCLLASPAGCVAEKSLGDPTGSEGADGSGTTGGDPTGGPDDTTPGSQSSTLADTQTTEVATEGDRETEAGSESDGVDTDTIEPGLCADYTPPPIECEAPGEAVVEYAGSDVYEAVDATCTVTSVEQDDFGTETLVLECGAESYAVGYTSRTPHLDPAVAVDDEVLFSYRDYELSPNLEPSFSLSSTDGQLLIAFVMHMQTGDPLPIDLGDLTVAYGGTGCSGIEVPAADCANDTLSIVAARVDVDVTLDQTSLVLGQGGSGTLSGRTMNYAVSVGRAQRIACWDEGCAGDEGGPFDLVELLVVAQP